MSKNLVNVTDMMKIEFRQGGTAIASGSGESPSVPTKLSIEDTLSLSRALKILFYDKFTGEFSWKESNNNHQAGERAGSVVPGKGNKAAVRSIKIGKCNVSEHRLAFFMVTGLWPKPGTVEHKNGNTTDNRWSNLRLHRTELSHAPTVMMKTVMQDRCLTLTEITNEMKRSRDACTRWLRDMMNATPREAHVADYAPPPQGNGQWIKKYALGDFPDVPAPRDMEAAERTALEERRTQVRERRKTERAARPADDRRQISPAEVRQAQQANELMNAFFGRKAA